MSKLIFGIDPGLDGAVAALLVEGKARRLVGMLDMPTAAVRVGKKLRRRVLETSLATQINNLSKAWADNPFEAVEDVHAVVEEVHAMPKQGVSSTFQFGTGYGIILGVLAGLGVPFKTVTPQAWQKAFSVRGKDSSRLIVGREFPMDTHYFKRAKDHGRADAALIAAYGVSLFK